MPTVDDKSLSLLKSAERWKLLVFHAVDDIGGWRDAPLRNGLIDSYPDVATGLLGPTGHLIAWATANHPNLDVSSLSRLHEIIVRWAGDHDSSALPPQAALVALSERALLIVDAIMEAILGYVRPDPITATESRELAAVTAPEVTHSVIPPLTDAESAVLKVVRGLPQGKGMSGKQIIAAAAQADPPETIDQATLTKTIIPNLRKHFDIPNRRGAGYYYAGEKPAALTPQ